jgi:hypothetical protein
MKLNTEAREETMCVSPCKSDAQAAQSCAHTLLLIATHANMYTHWATSDCSLFNNLGAYLQQPECRRCCELLVLPSSSDAVAAVLYRSPQSWHSGGGGGGDRRATSSLKHACMAEGVDGARTPDCGESERLGGRDE